MRNIRVPVLLALAMAVIAWGVAQPLGLAAEHGRRGIERVLLEDDCDTNDATWDNPDGSEGCELKGGTVTRAEFMFYSFWTPPGPTSPPGPPPGTPLANAVIGHPSWRNDPGYLAVEPGQRLRVLNAGGRGHTFTSVANFGGGFVPPLSFGLTQAPECAAIAGDASQVIAPGARAVVTNLMTGEHKFQCCIHPWMRTLVKVEASKE